MPISYVLETHVHNDYVSGGRELAAKTGAKIIAGEIDPLVYADRSVREGDAIALGKARFQVLHTPGHTPEHVSYLLFEPGNETPSSLFSGGSMLVGNAGRTDLLGPAHTLTLTKQQYATLRRLLDTLPGQVRVYPTHGAGSFCMSTSANSGRTTTIAQERLVNPAALAPNEEAFVQRQIAGYSSYPRYYAHMGFINRKGPRILGAMPTPPPLAPLDVLQRISNGLPLIDGRNRDAFAREHIPGALNIELDSSFATYVGWLLPFNVPLLILIEDEAGRREAVVQLMRIGFEQVDGYLDGGIAAWKAAALPTTSFGTMDIEALHKCWSQHEKLTILDVRRPDEWREGHIPGALHVQLGDLPLRMRELPDDQTIATICRSGHRAEIAASMVAATGREVLSVRGGMEDWLKLELPSAAGLG